MTTLLSAVEGSGGKAVHLNVRDYGATGNGTTDDASAFSSAIAAASSGDALFIPAGDYRIRSALAVSKALRFVGENAGAPASSGSRLRTDGASTNNLFEVSSDHVVFENLTIGHTGSPGSGAGIQLTSGQYATIRSCRFKHATGIKATGATRWSIVNSVIADCITYGVHVASGGDTGDWTIRGNQFLHGGSATAAIFLESAAGRIIDNKIQHHTYGIDVQIPDGVTTTNLQVANNSIEDQVTSNVRIGRAGTTGALNKINLVGNECFISGSSLKNVVLAAGIKNVVVVGNIIQGSGTGTVAIDITGGSNMVIEGNSLVGVATGIQVGASPTVVNLGAFSVEGVTTLYSINTGAALALPLVLRGSGTPEGALPAPVGAVYQRSDGGANTSFYVKESGTGTTGWVGK